MGQAPKKPELFNKLANAKDSGAGYDLVANIVVGLGVIWVARWIWPSLPKSAYGFGVVLGAISGFYQLFKSQSKPHTAVPPDKKKKDDAQPPVQLP